MRRLLEGGACLRPGAYQRKYGNATYFFIITTFLLNIPVGRP